MTMTMEHIGNNLKKFSFEQPAPRPQESSKKEPKKEPFIPFPRFLVEHYRNRLITYRELELFVRLLEPLMLLLMGIVILFVMIALLLPVFQSAGALG